jgi:hypothetical protein
MGLLRSSNSFTTGVTTATPMCRPTVYLETAEATGHFSSRSLHKIATESLRKGAILSGNQRRRKVKTSDHFEFKTEGYFDGTKVFPAILCAGRGAGDKRRCPVSVAIFATGKGVVTGGFEGRYCDI